ncbi:hypothetical protein SH1V18_08200 [Vallitalea longa]|uniref:Aminoglycoside phosphotransferase domain-containing protein n=1 Tax=Vallitalea longa TaxID=2936439 RepID=A0A9W5Y970_9FIRM|nr:hypothetical protein [Vallitalea longa]GKX28340.1 hypothetical protein SH1V18_08200 [Vallitalea longa]
MQSISEETIRNALTANGFLIRHLKKLSGGSNHFVFAAKMLDDSELIIKFPRIRETELTFSEGNKDTLFGGKLSLEREAYLFDLIRNASLPSPKVFGIYPTAQGNCIVVERSPGCNLNDYMNNHSHSLDIFLDIMKNLGSDFRKLHKTRFTSFGNIMNNSEIEPSGIMNFADRYLPINDMLLKKCRTKGGINDEEYTQLKLFFDSRFESFRTRLDIKQSPATLVITDMHGDNFFVENNKSSGYFDVESSQAAPLEFELYALRFFVFNYYGIEEFKLAERAFWKSYTKGKSEYPDTETNDLIDFFSACRLLEIFQSYWGYVDGIRDSWGLRIKNILFDYINTGCIDYNSLGAIWRERDKQPLHANKTTPI